MSKKFNNPSESMRQRAGQLRNGMTTAEVRLWGALRKKRRKGFKFRRQHVIGAHIVDFYCHRAKLIIEVDGETHRYTGDKDVIRQQYLVSKGFTVLRFENKDVFRNLEAVVTTIDRYLAEVE